MVVHSALRRIKDFAEYAGRVLIGLAVLHSLTDMLKLDALQPIERVAIGAILLVIILPIIDRHSPPPPPVL